MLNHDVTQFKEVARYSLKLDIEKRGVPTTQKRENFFGYKLKNDGHLDTKTLFGCQSDWPDMLRYARKLGVIVTYFNEKAIVRIGDKRFDDSCSLQKVLFRLTVDRDLEKVKQLSIQGPYLCLSGIQLKSSHSVLYNWSIQDSLVKFVIKARLSLLPTNFTLHIWNRENCPMCPFCRSHTESIAHLMNGCRECHNLYNRRPNCIADKITDEIKLHLPRYRVYSNKLAESLFPELQDSLSVLLHRKPDIVVMDRISRICFIVEIKVCFDLYFEYAYLEKNVIHRY